MSNNPIRNLNLNHLPIFVAIAESKSLTEAARGLQQDKTRVSRILAELENHFKTELVYRTTRDLRLTEMGQLFYIRCKELVAKMEDVTYLVSQNGTEVVGHICLTAAHGVASALLPIAMKEFGKLYPRVTFEVRMTQQRLNLVKEGIDIALRVGKLEDSSYIARRIGLVRYAFIASPRLLNTMAPLRKLENLENAKIATLSHFNKKQLRFKRGNDELPLRLNGAIDTNSPDLILNFALQDMAIGFLPEFVSREHVAAGRLIKLFEKWQLEPAPLSALFHKSNRRPAQVTLFLDFLANYFAQVLQ